MSKKAFVSALTFCVLFCSYAVPQERAVGKEKAQPPGYSLHGKTYMGFMDLSDNPLLAGKPAATTDAFLPVYFVFGQYDDKIYGALVIPSEEAGSAPPAQATNIILEQHSIIEGEMDGGEISFRLDDMEEMELDVPIVGKILEAGNKISLSATVPILGKIPLVDIFICNEDQYLSGQYLGTAQWATPSAPALNNFMIGVLVQGTKFSFTAFVYDPENPNERYTLTGEGVCNPNNYTFSFDGNAANEEPDVEGKIQNGVITLTMDFGDDYAATATLNFFGDTKHKKPKLKPPKPKNVTAGKVTKVRVKHRNALMGSLVEVAAPSAAPPNGAIGITRYDYSSTYFDIWLDVPAGASKGKYYINLTGPDGKTATSKKPFIVK
jgi:hypothetical protein